MISIVLIEPKTPANIGSVARAMKNFGFNDLILVNPRCNPLDNSAKKLARHAQDILKSARTKPKTFLKTFDYIIATTAKLGTDYNLPRSPITPEQLSGKLSKLSQKSKIALLLGREDIGLTNDEIQEADFSVSIPASPKYPTLSISHSAAILLYEISKNQPAKNSSGHIAPISKKEKDLLLKQINALLSKLPFATKNKRQTQRTLWKKIIGKSFLTRREAFALFGFIRKLNNRLKK